MTEVPDDIGQFDDLFPAFLKLGCHTVALTDVPAHLWHIEVLKKSLQALQSSSLERTVTTGEQTLCFVITYLYGHVIRFAGCS